MDIIFKFGEHYYDSGDNSIWIQFALTVLGAFLGFGSALLIYYKSVKREKLEHETNLLIESKNKLMYHKLLIENLIKNTNFQIEALDKYIIEQEKDLLSVIPPRQIATNDFKRLIFINKDIFESFNHFYIKNIDWIEDLKKLHTTIDYIDGIFSEIFRMTTNHLKEYYIKASEIKQKIELIPDRLSSFAFYLQNQLGEERWKNKLYIFVNDSINQYIVLIEAKADFNRINTEYFEPLLKIILAEYKKEPFFEEIMFLARSSRVKMNDIRTDVLNMIEEMGRVKIELVNSLTKVEESIKKLNNVLQ